MGRHGIALPAVFALLTVLCLGLSGGCGRRQKPADEPPQEQARHFTLQHLAGPVRVELSGEVAHAAPDRSGATVRQPSLSLANDEETIEISGGQDGSAEVKMGGSGSVEQVVLKGDIAVVQRDRASGKIVTEARCRRLTYEEARRLLTMEGNPVIRWGRGVFSGDRILYYWTEKKVMIEGNVNAVFSAGPHTAP